MVSGVASRSFGQILRRVGRVYLHTSFGTGTDVFIKDMSKSIFTKVPKDTKWWQIGKKYKGSDWSNFGKKFGNAYNAVERDIETSMKANGGSYMKALWKDIQGLWKEPIAAYQAAQKAGKSGLWAGIRGLGSSALKRFPLIGGAIVMLGSFGDIKAAFTDKEHGGGLVSGILEIGKSFAGLGLDMAGFAIGQALIPIPFVGGLIGSLVVGGLGRKIIGQPWRQAHAQETQMGGGEMGGGGASRTISDSESTTNAVLKWNPVKPGITEDEIMALALSSGYQGPQFNMLG